MGKYIVFAEQGVSAGHIIIAAVCYQGAPPATGDIGEADMVSGPIPTIKIGNSERTFRRQVSRKFLVNSTHIGRVNTEGQRMLFKDIIIGLQRVLDKQQGTAEYRATEFIEESMPGIVTVNDTGRFLKSLCIQRSPVRK